MLTVLASVVALAAILFLLTAKFSRKQEVSGWLAPGLGMVESYAPPGAVVQAIHVRLGQRVVRGQILATLSTDTYAESGAMADLERSQIARQASELDAQVASSDEQRRLTSGKSLEQARALEAGIVTLQEQRRLMEDQLAVARKEDNDTMPLVEKGLISKFDHNRRRMAVLTLLGNVQGIDRQISEQRSRIEELRADAAAGDRRTDADISRLRAGRSVLAVNLANLDYRSNGTTRAAAAGTVVGVNARPGQTVQPGLPLVSIAPPGDLEAELLVPSSASGLMRSGLNVRVSVDAFPFQQYGVLRGQITEVGRTTVTPNEYQAPIAFTGPAYRVRVKLRDQNLLAYGKRRVLEPGMTLKADIVTEKRTLLQWLFDPIYAARKALQD
ncbi:MAG: HlyD family efflux transporter periplasmic adaptor subunit [Sphingomonas sp.]|uniref:HlyD family secretion protein n=1 Tax=Sphingomonas sp. TaxID=28214 RepID=UPI003563F8CB